MLPSLFPSVPVTATNGREAALCCDKTSFRRVGNGRRRACLRVITIDGGPCVARPGNDSSIEGPTVAVVFLGLAPVQVMKGAYESESGRRMRWSATRRLIESISQLDALNTNRPAVPNTIPLIRRRCRFCFSPSVINHRARQPTAQIDRLIVDFLLLLQPRVLFVSSVCAIQVKFQHRRSIPFKIDSIFFRFRQEAGSGPAESSRTAAR